MTTTDVTTAELGLRERKRLATRHAIKAAALELVDERQSLSVTVDEISARADVSPRTFFNYFATKDEALLGDPPQAPSPHLVDRFTSGGSGDLLNDLRDLAADVWRDAEVDVEHVQLRQRILKRFPELAGQKIATMRAFEEDFSAIVAQRLGHDHPEERDDDLQRRARLITLVAIAAIRSALLSWSGGPTAGLRELVEKSFEDLRRLFA